MKQQEREVKRRINGGMGYPHRYEGFPFPRAGGAGAFRAGVAGAGRERAAGGAGAFRAGAAGAGRERGAGAGAGAGLRGDEGVSSLA